jgi:DNA-binding NarL/FixJ family response regulator
VTLACIPATPEIMTNAKEARFHVAIDARLDRGGLPRVASVRRHSVNELANQLILYGIHLQMVSPTGAATPVRCVRRSAEPLVFGDSLTAGESRIASMATAGSTNREIAQWLHISHKTVEAHLGHIYGKLGVRSRTELAYLLSREHAGMQPRHAGKRSWPAE